MTCGVAISSSPVFSPPSSLFCKSTSEALTLTHSPSASSSSPPSSPARFLRLQKPPPQPSGLVVRSGSKESSFSSSASSSVPASTSPSVLKRKRPTRLDIPIVSMSFSSNPAATPRAAEAVEVEEDEYAVCCKKGRREAMEDRYSVVLSYNGDSKQAFFGVFDGHGGAKAAQFAAENLDKNVMNEVEKRKDNEIEEAVKHGYLKTDSEFLKQEVRGGTCCVTALIRKGKLVVSNAGDCRAVVSRGGVAEALTCDHRPSREDEKHRIEALGGYVDDCHSVWRIQGSLAVSRGIGDQYLKQWVIAEPETRVLGLEPDLEFLILASDGLWDKVGNQEAVDIARSLCIGVDKPQPLSACKQLVDLSVSRGSADDTSVVLIRLGRFLISPFSRGIV